jgi:hypothetical protein
MHTRNTLVIFPIALLRVGVVLYRALFGDKENLLGLVVKTLFFRPGKPSSVSPHRRHKISGNHWWGTPLAVTFRLMLANVLQRIQGFKSSPVWPTLNLCGFTIKCHLEGHLLKCCRYINKGEGITGLRQQIQQTKCIHIHANGCCNFVATAASENRCNFTLVTS